MKRYRKRGRNGARKNVTYRSRYKSRRRYRALKKKVVRIIESNAEHKYIVTPSATIAPAASTVNTATIVEQSTNFINVPAEVNQGTAVQNRVGNEIKAHNFFVRSNFWYTWNGATNYTVAGSSQMSYVHLVRSLAGNTGGNAGTLATNVTNAVNAANAYQTFARSYPSIDEKYYGFRIQKSWRIPPPAHYFTQNSLAWVVPGQKPTIMTKTIPIIRSKKGIKLKYDSNGDTRPMNTWWGLIIVNATAFTLNYDINSYFAFTDA